MNRRRLLQLIAAVPAAGLAMPREAASRASSKRPMMINGAGVLPGASPQDGYRLSPRDVADIRQAGWSALTETLTRAGNLTDSYERLLSDIAVTDATIQANPETLSKVLTASDVLRSHADGKLGVIYAIQDSSPIGPDLSRVATLQAKGLRVMQLTYNKRNLAGDGALERDNAGLSDLGRQTIEAAEAAKVVLDLAHGGERTTAQSLAHAKRPMLISHTGAKSVYAHPRNIDDAAMRACAEKGGAVGVYFISFLTPTAKPQKADVIAHLEHMLNQCGEDHICIGTDTFIRGVLVDAATREANRRAFEDRKARGIAAPGESADASNFTEGYNDPRRLQTLADDLIAAGWPTGRVEKLLGANYLRVCRDVWGS